MAGTVFRREFIELIGSRPDEGEVRVAELKLRGDAASGRASVRRYIASLPQYEAKYRDIISKVYTINCESAPDEDTVRFFLKRFARPGYGPDQLAEEIVHGVPDSADPDVEMGSEPGVGDTESDADAMLAFARRWQAATGEKIDIYEFVRYFRERPDKETIKRLADSQQAALLYVDKVHRDYLGRGVSRDEFLERYLSEHDRPRFDAEVMETVLGGEEYRMEMCKQIRGSFEKLFGVSMHPDDVDHVFEIIRDRRSGLYSEDINEELIRANDALREVHGAVAEVYRDVLGREADPDETRACVATFRAYGPDFAASELRSRLHDSLEFHDVIKARFRASFEGTHGRPPRTREVYDALAKILHEHAADMGNALSGL